MEDSPLVAACVQGLLTLDQAKRLMEAARDEMAKSMSRFHDPTHEEVTGLISFIGGTLTTFDGLAAEMSARRGAAVATTAADMAPGSADALAAEVRTEILDTQLEGMGTLRKGLSDVYKDMIGADIMFRAEAQKEAV